MSGYYKDQLDKLKVDTDKSTPHVIFENNSGSTNWLSINNESASEIVKWLKDNFVVTEL